MNSHRTSALAPIKFRHKFQLAALHQGHLAGAALVGLLHAERLQALLADDAPHTGGVRRQLLRAARGGPVQVDPTQLNPGGPWLVSACVT